MASVESVNVGEARPLAGNDGETGIYKEAAHGAVQVGALGLAGDHIGDAANHGGPDQAVYIYFADDYAWWAQTLGREPAPGTFGDNLTISGLASADLAVGDRLVAGSVVLEATAPRIPCNTLARRMQDPGFVKAFRHAARPGVYCRVIATGEIAAGTEVAHLTFAGKRVGTVEMFRDNFVARTLDASRIREVLAAPIAVREREKWEKFLRQREKA